MLTLFREKLNENSNLSCCEFRYNHKGCGYGSKGLNWQTEETPLQADVV